MRCSKHKWVTLEWSTPLILEWCERCGTVRKRARYETPIRWEYFRPTRVYPKKKKLPPMPKTLECVWALYTAKYNFWGTYRSLSEALDAATERGMFHPKFCVERFDRVTGSTKTYDHDTTERPPATTQKERKNFRWLLYDADGEVFGSDYLNRQEAWDDAMGPRFRPRFRVTKYEYAKGTRRHYKFRGTCDE